METLKYIEVIDGQRNTEVRIHTTAGGISYRFREGAHVDEIVGTLYRMAAQLATDAAYRAANKPSKKQP